MNKEEMLYSLRDYVIDGNPASGPYVISPLEMYEISKATGICFIPRQRKEDWREVVRQYWKDREKMA